MSQLLHDTDQIKSIYVHLKGQSFLDTFFLQKNHTIFFDVKFQDLFCFYSFFLPPFLKTAFRCLKWGVLTLIWNLVLDFFILKRNFPHYFRDYRVISAVLKRGFLHWYLRKFFVRMFVFGQLL